MAYAIITSLLFIYVAIVATYLLLKFKRTRSDKASAFEYRVFDLYFAEEYNSDEYRQRTRDSWRELQRLGKEGWMLTAKLEIGYRRIQCLLMREIKH